MNAEQSIIDSEEFECRVCRNGSDNDNPLYHPCRCSGSIGLVHQDCLEQWLSHSKKDTCELCFSKYHFEPQYAENTPDIIPLGVLISSIFKLSLFKCLPFMVRIVTAIIVWLVFVPIGTTCVYSICIGRHNLITREFSWVLLKSHITNGIVLDAVIALSLLILVSFTDFLRFHWIPGGQENPHPQRPNAPVVVAPAAAANDANINRRNLAVNNNNNNNRAMNPQAIGAANFNRLNRPVAMDVDNDDRRAEERLLLLDDEVLRRDEFLHNRRHLDEIDDTFHGRVVVNSSGGIDGTRDGARSVFPPKNPFTLLNKPSTDLDRKLSSDEDGSPDEKEIKGDFKGDLSVESISGSSSKQQQQQQDIDAAIGHIGDDDLIVIDSQLVSDHDRTVQAGTDGPDMIHMDDYDDDENDENDALQRGEEKAEGDYLVGREEEEGEEGGALVDIEVPILLPPAIEVMHVDDNMVNEIGNRPDLADGLLDAADADADDDNVQEVGLEIRVAVLDLLGIEGPVHLMFRNSLWLLGFCSLYLTSSAALPYIIGYKVVQLLRVADLAHMLREVRLVRFVLEVHHQSVEENTPLQMLDFIYIGIGLVAVFVVVFVVSFTSQLAQKLKLSSLLATYYDIVKKLSIVIKVGILLIVRIFLLPLFLGSVILSVFAHVLLPFKWSEWVSFFAQNCVSACSLAWVAGITFMLTMTISVLQLREVLHPDFLAKIIRPQEPHMDLINSLVHEGGLLHIRRIAVSCIVYLMLMLLFLVIPVLILHQLCTLLGIDPTFHLKFWYLVPEVQIPLELLVLHVSFLALLDKRKDLIGRLQHLWLLHVSNYMGATRYLIPLPLYGTAFQPAHNTAAATADPTAAAAAVEENMLPRVGRPLRRPPAGWDLRAPHQSTRWAWGSEEPSSLERHVAPRVIPKNWFSLLAIIILQSWTLLICITILILVVPLNVGKVLLHFSLFPSRLSHDPLCFILGSVACLFALVFGVRVAQRMLYTQFPLPSILRQLKVNVALQGLKVMCLYFVVQSSIGFVCMTQLLDSSSVFDGTWKDAHLLHLRWIAATILVSLKAFVFGFILSSVAIYALTNDRWRAYVDSIHLDSTLLDFVRLIKRMHLDVQLALMNRSYSREALQLNEFEYIIINVLFPAFVYKGSVLVMVLGYVLTCTREMRVGLVGVDRLLPNMRIVSTLMVLLRIGQMLYRPAVHWLGVFYSKIRNDNYLIGRTLINKSHRM